MWACARTSRQRPDPEAIEPLLHLSAAFRERRKVHMANRALLAGVLLTLPTMAVAHWENFRGRRVNIRRSQPRQTSAL